MYIQSDIIEPRRHICIRHLREHLARHTVAMIDVANNNTQCHVGRKKEGEHPFTPVDSANQPFRFPLFGGPPKIRHTAVVYFIYHVSLSEGGTRPWKGRTSRMARLSRPCLPTVHSHVLTPSIGRTLFSGHGPPAREEGVHKNGTTSLLARDTHRTRTHTHTPPRLCHHLRSYARSLRLRRR